MNGGNGKDGTGQAEVHRAGTCASKHTDKQEVRHTLHFQMSSVAFVDSLGFLFIDFGL